MKEVLNVGVIGTGKFGQFLIESYKDLKNVKVYGIFSRSREKLVKLSKKYKIPYFSTDYTQLIKHKEIDIIVIATPPFLHGKMALESVKAGKNVLVEKPLSITKKEADLIKEELKKHKVKFKIDYILRENPLIKKLKLLFNEEILGKPQNIVFKNFASDSHLSEKHWFWDKRKSGGIWIEHGVHFFDLFSYLLNQKVKKIVSASVKRNKNIEDQVSCLAVYDECLASYIHSFTKPGEIEETSYTISFDKGHVKVGGWIPMELKIYGMLNENEFKKLKNIFNNVRFKKIKKIIKGRGKEYKVSKKIKVKLRLKNREEVYKDSCKEVMKNFANSIASKYGQDFGFNEAYSSLITALEAENNKKFAHKI